MDLSNLLAAESLAFGARRFVGPTEGPPGSRQYSSRHMAPAYNNMQPHGGDLVMTDIYPTTEAPPAHEMLSPTKAANPKHVSFELLLPQSPQHRARLPMRVNIFPHDTTDSIITTVKNFYGLYERRGVIFEDRHGNILIARYENLDHDMVVYVRVTAEDPEMDEYSPGPPQSTSPRRPRLEEAFQMLPPALNPASRPHAAVRQSQSPQPGRGRRSASASTNMRPRGRPLIKSRGTSSHGSFADPNGDVGGYSDSDGGDASVTSSRRSRKEQVTSADISVDNIVEGGRRKRAKFDSSELPLFVPPQVPMTASLSSVSPQRRISSQNGASPYSLSNQQTFSYSHPLPSPQSFVNGDSSYLQGLTTPYSTSTGPVQGYRSRTRGSAQYAPYRHVGNNGGVLPTPDSTLGSISVISDEDVARQLMRLGDASNFSAHGRTSTSTMDDALSGKAEIASSIEESDEGSDEDDNGLPPLSYIMGRGNGANGQAVREFDSGDTSGDEYEDNKDGSFKGESDGLVPGEHQDQAAHPGAVRARSSVPHKVGKPGKPRALSKSKTKPNGATKPPMSPTSLPSQSRKASSASINFQHQLGVDEEDLSSKPRCQRCRKSKKGCDRQRPCQRCKDAGIGVDGCVSEDEGNGRKGRYGRHMGVPVKKEMEPPATPDYAHHAGSTYAAIHTSAIEKSKKRKR
ncbi:hypothetical protein K505DRAFT_231234 [Melanomma pulvis-pyrius CBS 109.77]|uniref:Zn(2)-C6 fungal-type domain-containing protein n=1 Tax=Melanomma pulvis-pyrius CBS 109.77 TaxID=1314802 RepID=A0A6A6XUC0_9PLEO|nr:hypothetical protein K505DRAFT_231234 [Melanomma pulvis-pyrius CBS 109.77]